MRRLTWWWLAVGATLGGCSYNPETVDTIDAVVHEHAAVERMAPQGPLFNQGLRRGYLDYVEVVGDRSDPGDYVHFVVKAVDSAKGELVLPDLVVSRSVPAVQAEELAAARARLIAALEQTGRKSAPFEAASAQTAFDCWLDQAALWWIAADDITCKGAFEAAMAEVERSLTKEGNVYLVFFAWDQAELTPVALAVLDQVSKDYQRGVPSQVVVAGHADRSGPEAYNEPLSEQRARNVARALGQRGVPRSALEVEWYGERRPRVDTPDGALEPQNRRVEIVFG